MTTTPGTLRPASLALLVLLAGCSGGDRESAAGPVRVPLVEALPARSGALPVEETLPGVVRARNQVAVRPETPGRVVEVLVRSGAAVHRGQPLVRLDDSEARERLRQAEADVRLAEAAAEAARARVAELSARVGRTRALAEQKLVSALELETQEAQLTALRAVGAEEAARVEQARAAAEERRSALAKSVVRSPLDGRLGERRVEVGMQVDPSTVLFLAGDLQELIVEVDLTQEMLATVGEGMPVELTARGGGEPIRAELSRISPFLAEESFTTRAEIDVENREGRLRPGMFVTVRIRVGESETATLVPVSAVWEDPATGQQGVFVVEETAGLAVPEGGEPAATEEPRAVSRRPVAMLAEGRGVAGVEGVEPGAWVVTVGQHLLAAELRAAAETAAAPPAEPRADARIRPISWARVMELQDLQNEDLLEGFLDKQRKVAAVLGAEIPASEEEVNRILSQSAPPPTP